MILKSLDYIDGDAALERFLSRQEIDKQIAGFPSYFHRWLFMERMYERGQRHDLNFFQFEGAAHITKFFSWIRNIKYPDFFADADLIRESIENDKRCRSLYNLPISDENIATIGLYNAQDYQLQRFYPVPDRLKVGRVLDFGAGHGRMANLVKKGTKHAPATSYVAVDGIPSSYLTQNLYYKGLGLSLAEYLDHDDPAQTFRFEELAAAHDVVHLPTWRMALLPDNWFDMVCCVQVLKELPAQLVPFVVKEFARVLKPGGALYIRDHVQFHHPNQMPVDEILAASGFSIEFRPHLIDRQDIHGLPRLWRKLDSNIYIDSDPNGPP